MPTSQHGQSQSVGVSTKDNMHGQPQSVHYSEAPLQCVPIVTYIQISSIVLHPPDHDVRVDHPSVGGQSKSHPAVGADIHCKRYGLGCLVELPVESVSALGAALQDTLEAVLGVQGVWVIMSAMHVQLCS